MLKQSYKNNRFLSLRKKKRIFDPLLSPSNKTILNRHPKQNQLLIQSLNIMTTGLSPISKFHSNEQHASSYSTITTNINLSMNHKVKGNQPFNMKSSCIGKKEKMYTNVSINKPLIKHNTTTSVSLENLDKDTSLMKVQREKEELLQKNKEQKKLISKLLSDNDKNERKLYQMREYNRELKLTIQDLKENESQLLLLIKIIGDKGIDIEEIIDKWNEEVKKNQENESESSFLNNIDSTSNRINDSSFVPITIDEEKENKVKNSNVPKLNFNFLHKKVVKKIKNEMNAI